MLLNSMRLMFLTGISYQPAAEESWQAKKLRLKTKLLLSVLFPATIMLASESMIFPSTGMQILACLIHYLGSLSFEPLQHRLKRILSGQASLSLLIVFLAESQARTLPLGQDGPS